ncbi:MAG: hypothetical protein O3B13_21105 [Planctomycetota bacterium]|nr:hypothetical protein [Planctomycetota bacterium]
MAAFEFETTGAGHQAMNGMPSNERLSAWLDDELPLVERAEVEQLLAESPELRQEVEELRRLSSQLKGLPREQAPVELQQAIMRSIERESLLPGDDSSNAVRRRRILRVLTAAAGIALVVGAGIWFATHDGQQLADVDPVRPEIVHVEQTRPTMQANKADLRNRRLPVDLPSRQFEIDRDALSAVDIGDIVEAVRRDGESVSIVRLTVVDREAGLKSLRVLLAHQDIPLDGSTDATLSDSDLASRGLVAVYVESRSEQLSHTIEEMAQQLNLEALSVSESLPIAKLDSGVRSELGLADSNDKNRASRAVSVQKGSSLEKMISQQGNYSANSGTSSKPASNNQPVRVIFVLTDTPTSPPAADTATSGNGAA